MTSIEDIRKRLEAATPNWWKAAAHNSMFGTVMMAQPDKTKNSVRIGQFSKPEDADLAVNAPIDLQFLLSELERKDQALAELVELKRMKESGENPQDYAVRKPIAWEAARQALKERGE